MTLWEDIGRKMNRYYIIHTRCRNCGHIQDAKIPKGEPKESYLKSGGVCENCGVIGMLQLRELEVRERDGDKKGKEGRPEYKWM